MKFREATVADIPELQRIRMSVKENVLRNASLVKNDDYVNYLTEQGKGWLCEIDEIITGFAIVDTNDKNIWALFVEPEYENKGIGTTLHDIMLEWFFNQSTETLWLGTAPETKAESFYRMKGWIETDRRPNGEIKFEMSHQQWEKTRKVQEQN